MTFGAQWMIHRRWDGQLWVVCEGTADGHEPDSRVHRYDRIVGFSISDEELAMCNRNPVMAAAERSARLRNKQISHAQTVRRWALVERYCLEFHPDEPYTRYLKKLELEAEEAVSDRLTFQAPPTLLMLAYTRFLRMKDPGQARPDRKGSTFSVRSTRMMRMGRVKTPSSGCGSLRR